MFKISLLSNKEHPRVIGHFYSSSLSYPIYEFLQLVLNRFPAFQFRITYENKKEE